LKNIHGYYTLGKCGPDLVTINWISKWDSDYQQTLPTN
jgi:hypothetical protein